VSAYAHTSEYSLRSHSIRGWTDSSRQAWRLAASALTFAEERSKRPVEAAGPVDVRHGPGAHKDLGRRPHARRRPQLPQAPRLQTHRPGHQLRIDFVEQPIAAAATANVSPRTEPLWSLNIERLLQARRKADARLRRGAELVELMGSKPMTSWNAIEVVSRCAKEASGFPWIYDGHAAAIEVIGITSRDGRSHETRDCRDLGVEM
jgi:hypothetical protein